MRSSTWNRVSVVLLTLALGAMPLAAQTGTVAGRVTDQSSGQAVAGARVVVTGTAGGGTATTSNDGSYRVAGLGAGTYMVAVSAIGFRAARMEGVQVDPGASATADIGLEVMVLQLEAITVAVGKAPEKVVDAPASVGVVPAIEITERPALTVVDHLKSLPGVDVSQGGLLQSNVVGRGFNNIFSGALLMLVDNRFASVPSLRVNVPAFFTATNEDIEQIEFVLGPGAALYGPNSANGVLAITTKSPFTSQGTSISLETGYRAASRSPNDPVTGESQKYDGGAGLWRFGMRHAGAGARVGYKLSAEFFQGKEWRMRDPAEPTSVPDIPDVQCGPLFGCRDFDMEKWNIDARVDVRATDNSELIGAFGVSNANRLLEYTGIGAGQARDWRYSYGQLRYRWNRLFMQVFGNFSNAGNADQNDRSGTFLLRSGDPIVDNSRVLAAQVQHGTDLGTRLSLIYGVDYAFTDARTDGTINGANEEDDSIREIGGYLHAVARLSPRFEVVGALRVDDHSRLAKANWSPRGALVFKPGEDQSIRFTYNRAFSTPSNNNLFLDIVAGSIPLGGGLAYDIRAQGVPEDGYSFRNWCPQPGLDGLCMRSPFAPDVLPANAGVLWPVARGAIAQRLPTLPLPPSLQPYLMDILNAFLAVTPPGPAGVGTQLRALDPTAGVFVDVDPSGVRDIARMKPSISNTFEVGYKGIFNSRVRLEVSGWYDRRNNFVGPLIVETPNIFLDPATTAAHLLADPDWQQLMTDLLGNGVSMADVQTLNLILVGGMAGQSGSAVAPGVPLGTVVPSNSTTPAMFLTYRNFGNVDLWGADFLVDYLIGDRWSVTGTYSFVSDDFFPQSEVGGLTDIALNASKSKFALLGRYRQGVHGLSAEGRVRYTRGFPVNSGVYVTPPGERIDSYVLVDTQVGYRLQGGLFASLSVQNLFNRNYQTFAGLPQLGRVVLSKLQYTF